MLIAHYQGKKSNDDSCEAKGLEKKHVEFQVKAKTIKIWCQ